MVGTIKERSIQANLKNRGHKNSVKDAFVFIMHTGLRCCANKH